MKIEVSTARGRLRARRGEGKGGFEGGGEPPLESCGGGGLGWGCGGVPGAAFGLTSVLRERQAGRRRRAISGEDRG
jgi:hypothetical protein